MNQYFKHLRNIAVHKKCAMAIVERGRSAFLESTKPSTDEGFLVFNTLTLLTGIKL
jgi:hypothetical protein